LSDATHLISSFHEIPIHGSCRHHKVTRARQGHRSTEVLSQLKFDIQPRNRDAEPENPAIEAGAYEICTDISDKTKLTVCDDVEGHSHPLGGPDRFGTHMEVGCYRLDASLRCGLRDEIRSYTESRDTRTSFDSVRLSVFLLRTGLRQSRIASPGPWLFLFPGTYIFPSISQ
jgi:hypothetical protein